MFADNLKRIRKEQNLSQEALADMLHISRQAVSKWEQGTAYPEIETLIDLSEKLGVSADELLKGKAESETVCIERNRVASEAGSVQSSKLRKKRIQWIIFPVCIALAAMLILLLANNSGGTAEAETGSVVGTIIAKERDAIVVRYDREPSPYGFHYDPEAQIFYVFRIDDTTTVYDTTQNWVKLEGAPWAILDEIELNTEVTVNWPVDQNRDPLSQGRNEPQDSDSSVNRTDIVASKILLQ